MRYKQIYKPLQLAICATLICASFTACSNSETDSLSATEETSVPLSISATIQSSTEARKADYDATYFETGDEIGLYILSVTDYESAYSSESTCYNVRATYNGSSWALDNDIYLNEEDAYVIAYYPYNESFGSTVFPTNFENEEWLTFDLTPINNEQTDVLTSAGVTVNSESPQAQLVFSHVSTRVILSIGLSDDIGTANLTSAGIAGHHSGIWLCIDCDNNSFNVGRLNYTTDYMTLSLDETLNATGRTNVDFLIASGSKTTLTAQLVIDGTSYSVQLTTDEWTAGCQYTYLINVKKTENEEDDVLLEVDTSSTIISDWTDKGTSDEIELGGTTDEEEDSDDGEEDSDDDEEEETDGVTYVNGYAAVDLGLSVKWATCNVGADYPEDYGNYYAWGETSTKSTYTSSNSTYYGVYTSKYLIEGSSKFDAATVNRGDSWRMPTLTETQEILENCTWEWTTQNEVKGCLVTGDNGNSIFLPAAGWKLNKGTYDRIEGFYWNSCDDYGTYNSGIILFNSSYASAYNYERYYGFPIRPVTD